MIKGMKPLAAVAVAAALALAPSLSRAETNKYCYDHPSDHSDYCYCYRHPKECNSQYRSHHPDWNQRPDEAYAHHHHHHNQAYYNQGHPPNGEGEYHGPPPKGGHYDGPPPNGQHYNGPPPYPNNGQPNSYNQGGQQYH